MRDALEGLPRPHAEGVRWTTRDQWHITLRFLGDASEEQAAATLGAVAANRAEVIVGPAVELLGADVTVAPVQGLDEVAAAVRAATYEVGDPPDPRPFFGHLTLARQKSSSCPLVGHPIRAEFTAEEVALVRSERRADGARYSIVATHRLSL